MKQIILGISLFSLLIVTRASAQSSAAPSPADTVSRAKVTKSKEEWKKTLTPEQYNITREEGTERPFSKGNLSDNHQKGMYYCVCCHNPLFSSATKFESGTGWPSFWQAYASRSVNKSTDSSLGMDRTAVSCERCGAHLGHVFNDGPKPTGLRYCMNGFALLFVKS